MKSYDQIAARSDAPLFIFGDHASAHIPPQYDHLGLSGRDLTRHIAVDIGTEGLIRQWADYFGCGAHLCAVSRLVIDCNRPLDAPDLIPPVSDGSSIPGNQNLTAAQRAERTNQIHVPYHNALSAAIVHAAQRLSDPLILSVHSFTEKPDTGPARDVEIGLLVKSDPQSADHAKALLAQMEPGLDVRINEPYTAIILNHSVDSQVAERGLRHLNIEVRQDLITTPAQQADMARRLAPMIAAIMMK